MPRDLDQSSEMFTRIRVKSETNSSSSVSTPFFYVQEIGGSMLCSVSDGSKIRTKSSRFQIFEPTAANEMKTNALKNNVFV